MHKNAKLRQKYIMLCFRGTQIWVVTKYVIKMQKEYGKSVTMLEPNTNYSLIYAIMLSWWFIMQKIMLYMITV